MADTENVAEDVTEISMFLLMVLEEGNDLLHQNFATEEFKDKVTTYLELLEATKKMLGAFYEVSEDKGKLSFPISLNLYSFSQYFVAKINPINHILW